jgi:hypothetical protein
MITPDWCMQVAMSKKELKEKEAREAAAKKAAEEWKAKQEADKALLERRKAATAAGGRPQLAVTQFMNVVLSRCVSGQSTAALGPQSAPHWCLCCQLA